MSDDRVLNPDGLRIGSQIQRRPAGRFCTVVGFNEDRSKVKVNDCGHVFWVRMKTLTESWK